MKIPWDGETISAATIDERIPTLLFFSSKFGPDAWLVDKIAEVVRGRSGRLARAFADIIVQRKMDGQRFFGA